MAKQDEVKRISELHAIAKEQFLDPAEGFRLRRHILEIARLRKADPIPADEARVMLFLSQKARPYEVRRSMSKLLNARYARDEMEEFRAFEAFLHTRMPADELCGHNFKTVPFAKQSHENIWDHLRNVMPHLAERTEGVFLNSGTLLGVVRNGKLLDHDDDVDLAVILRASSPVEAAQEWRKLCFSLYQAGLARLEDQSEGVPKIIKLVSDGGYEIDLFPAWFQGDDFFVVPHTYGALKREDVLPLKTCEITGLPIPAEPEKMLAVNYGASWRISNPYYVFNWKLANKRFTPYLKALEEVQVKRAITYGTFDLFHVGHVRLFARLAKLADEVVVACSTCEFNEGKGKKTVLSYEQRVEMISACMHVTKVIEENDWDQKRGDIVTHQADVFVMGDDWQGKFDDLSDLCDVLYLPRTKNISTTMLKNGLKTERKLKKASA